jgi:hypothetical protein
LQSIAGYGIQVYLTAADSRLCRIRFRDAFSLLATRIMLVPSRNLSIDAQGIIGPARSAVTGKSACPHEAAFR